MSDRPSTPSRDDESVAPPDRDSAAAAPAWPESVRARFPGLIRRLRRGELDEAAAARAHALIAAACEAREARRSMPMRIEPPDAALPIAAAWDEIAAAITRHPVVVVRGATGSGKSTQLPRIALSLGRGIEGVIAVTEPRRIAARAIATRIAEECGVVVGTGVGWRTRFERRCGPSTRVEVCTDGVLAASLGRDRMLRDCDTVIIDEAHERSITVDLLLGALKMALRRRDDLRVVIASATLAAEPFAAFFGGAPIIEVEGRQHPVETRYRPLEHGGAIESDSDWLEAIVAATDEAIAEQQGEPGDVLVFLPTTRSIDEAAESLRGRLAGVPLLPLHARLDVAAQDAAFRRPSGPRVILATNVAETSLTLPWVRSVVDSGLARVRRYDPRRRVARLRVEPISRASAAQRRGRCGRMGPGLCLRLYGEEDLAKRPEFTPPEILRTGLAGTMLELAERRLPSIESFPWLDPPSPVRLAEATRTLWELGAIERVADERGGPVERINTLGRRLGRLPLDPRLARIVDGGIEERCLAEAIVIAAALAVPDPRLGESGPTRRDETDAAPGHTIFRDPRSDFLSLLRLYRAWSSREQEGSASAARRWARRHQLNFAALREWTATARQLAALVRRFWRVRVPPLLDGLESPDPVRVHRAVLRGLVGGVAARERRERPSAERQRTTEGEFVTVDGVRASIWPGSSLPREHGGLVVSAEVVETGRRWIRTVAAIRSSWVEQIAPHLLSREHFEPHWVPETGQVAAWERVKLGEVVIVPRRRVPFGPVDPAAARQVFIQGALVEGRWRTRGRFAERNAQLLASLAELEARSRRPHAALREQAVFEFFDRRIPASIHSGPSFERWRRRLESRSPKRLWMRPRDLVGDWIVPDREAFPDEWVAPRGEGPSLRLGLRYRHEPGGEQDGITLEVPIEALATVDPQRVEWLVPGRLEEKVLAVVRGLPKAVRVRLHPMKEIAASVARECAEPTHFAVGSLWEALARRLSRHAGEAIEPSVLSAIELDPSLRLRIEVRDKDGQVLEAGRDLAALRDRWRCESERRLDGRAGQHEALSRWSRDRIASLDVEPLPLSVSLELEGRVVEMYPALELRDDGVALRLEADRGVALASTYLGLRRLFAVAAREAIRHHLDYHSRWSEAQSLHSVPTNGETKAGRSLEEATIDLVCERAYRIDPTKVRDARQFEARLEQGGQGLFDHVDQVVTTIADAGRVRRELKARLEAPCPQAWERPIADIRRRLVRLDPRAGDFHAELLPGLARFTSALQVRLERLRSAGPERDGLDAVSVAACEALVSASGCLLASPAGRQLRLLLEELQVAVFADRLGTATPISLARFERACGEARINSSASSW